VTKLFYILLCIWSCELGLYKILLMPMSKQLVVKTKPMIWIARIFSTNWFKFFFIFTSLYCCYYCGLIKSNILLAEIRFLLRRINLYWEVGFKKNICSSDFFHVVQLVAKKTSTFHHYANILQLIWSYLFKNWSISIHHILIEYFFVQIFLPS
jgi:hypothetical protein